MVLVRNVQIKKRMSLHPVPIFHGKCMDKQWKQWQTLFPWDPKSLQILTSTVKQRRLLLGREAMKNLDSILKSRDLTLSKGLYSQIYGFSRSRERKWKLDHKEGWEPRNWCFCTVVSDKTLESPLDCKEIQAVHSKGNQSWIFIGRTDAEAEPPLLWPIDG